MTFERTKRLREDEDEEDEDVVAAFLLYVEMIRRQHMAYGQLRICVESVISYYVHLRGGINEVFNIEVPVVKFQPQLLCEKWFT